MRVTMGRTFQEFIDALAAGPDSAALHAAMKDIAVAFEIDSFAYIFAPAKRSGEIRIISNYPQGWTARYLAQGYDKLDPVIEQVRSSADPFEWGLGASPSMKESGQDSFMEEAASFGVTSGITFPIYDACCRFAALTFASSSFSPALRSCFERQRQVLQLLAILFHAKARVALSPQALIGGIRLSSRESECLSWAAKGKSAWEIGRILNVSRRTAAFHLDNAKMKLGVRTIQQAVALFAASHGQ